MIRAACRFLFSFLIFLPTALMADFSRSTTYQPQGDLTRFEQRKQYQEAIRHIKNGRRQRYLALAENLTTYPLYPYLEYTDKIYNLWRQSPGDIQGFIDQYGNLPLTARLRENYLFALGKQGNWETFLRFYETDRQAVNACYHARALYETGDLEAALAAATELWLVGKSQPDECDPVFRMLRDNDGLTDDLAWQRFALAMEADERRLAAYLVRFLPADAERAAAAYQNFRSNSGLVRQTNRYLSDDPRMIEAVLYGLRRLSRREAADAWALYQRYDEAVDLATHGGNETLVYIGKRIAWKDDPDNLLAAFPESVASEAELLEARLRLHLERQEYVVLPGLITDLPEPVAKQPVWQFWLAMASLRGGTGITRAEAEAMLRELAQQRNFYGFLAADYLELPYQFADEPADVSEEQVLAMEATPGMQRAYELLTLGERGSARSEWYYLTREFSNREKQIAARVATRWGWHKSAIQALIDAEAWNELALRFPLAYRDMFLENARAAEIPVNWSFAIARQESAFMPDARSSAGARGLMQLMPGTAELIAGETGTPYNGSDRLVEPTYNIRLGSQYLGKMLRRFNNNRVLASAAYNAGPARVERWRNPELPLAVWIEVIPFGETRNYVQNILMFAAIYARQLNQEQPFIYPHEYRDFAVNYLTARDVPIREVP